VGKQQPDGSFPLIAQHPIDVNGTAQGDAHIGPCSVSGGFCSASDQAIYMTGATNVYIHDNEIWNTINGVKFAAMGSPNNSFATGLRFVNNKIHDCPRHGIDIGNLSKWVTINGNEITNGFCVEWSCSCFNGTIGYHSDAIQM